MNIPSMVVGATAPEAAVRPCYPPAAMGKTLIIAEKPSVGQDYAKALQERFEKHEGYLESDEHVVSWAIGHLVELAEPEDYDEALKRVVDQDAAGAPREVQAEAGVARQEAVRRARASCSSATTSTRS